MRVVTAVRRCSSTIAATESMTQQTDFFSAGTLALLPAGLCAPCCVARMPGLPGDPSNAFLINALRRSDELVLGL